MLPHDKHCVPTQPVGRWVFTEVAMIGNGGVVGIVLIGCKELVKLCTP